MSALERALSDMINCDGYMGIRSCIAALTTAYTAGSLKKSDPPVNIKLPTGAHAMASLKEYKGHGEYLVLVIPTGQVSRHRLDLLTQFFPLDDKTTDNRPSTPSAQAASVSIGNKDKKEPSEYDPRFASVQEAYKGGTQVFVTNTAFHYDEKTITIGVRAPFSGVPG